jgi:amino acid adenylation domain-containing protein
LRIFLSFETMNKDGATASSTDGATADPGYSRPDEWHDTLAPFPDESCIHELFESQVARSPDAVALVDREHTLSYRELNERANQVAHYLRGLGVGADVLVGLCVERSSEALVALLGILKAGGAYVPLDPAYPKARLAFILADAEVEVLLTQEAIRHALSGGTSALVSLDGDAALFAREAVTSPVTGTTADDLAYVIYTSGSTGAPKGVAMNHRPVCNLVAWQHRQSVVGAGDRTLQLTSLSFDVSVQEIFATLCSGGTLVLVPEDLRRDNKALLRLIAEESIARIFLPFSPLQQLAETALREAIAPASLREIMTAGEQLRITPQIAGWLEQLNDCKLYNQYGPTETHVVMTSFPLQGEIYILDQERRPVPSGSSGELYIGGVCLARGYLNRPDLTAERFIRDPFSDSPHARLYRSGDIGRYLPDGNIEFLGRNDAQVKIRGYRIELGEVEAALDQHASVRQAAVVVSQDAAGDRRLVAYLVLSGDHVVTASELRAFLFLRLPEFMIPARFVTLDTLPLTPSGKVDRKLLVSPETARPELGNNYCAPQSPVEQVLAGIWADVLGLDQVGTADNFFELGGDSLKVGRVLTRIYTQLGSELSQTTMFDAPTIAGLAAHVELAQRKSAPASVPVRPIDASAQSTPLALVQEAIWVAAESACDEPFYNESFTIDIGEDVETAALERALNAFIERHDSLRTGFVRTGGVAAQRRHEMASLRLTTIDLGALEPDARATRFNESAGKAVRRRFDLGQPPLLRATLFRFDAQRSRLHLVLHHIICDAYAVYEVLLPELYALYRGFTRHCPANLPGPPLPYADYVRWQREYLLGDAIERDRVYWEAQLAGLEPLELPSDRPRSRVCTHRGEFIAFALPQELSDALSELSQREGVTLYMLLLAAFNALLWRHSGCDDIAVGTVTSDRPRAEFEAMFGLFVNSLVLRTDVADDPRFDELLLRIRAVAVAAYAHHRYPFAKLVERLQPQTDPSRHLLFQVAFVMEPALAAHASGWTVSQLAVQSGTAKFDLLLEVERRAEGIIGRFEYSTDLFDRATIERMAGHFETLLEGLVQRPQSRLSELPLLSAGERQQLLVAWNDTTAPYPRDACVHELFQSQVALAPGAVALVEGKRILTYGELNARANQLAHHLLELRVGPDVLVGLCLSRSADAVIAILAILKAGGAYAPLDPSDPAPRLAFMLQDTQAPVLITQAALREQLAPYRGQVICMDSDWPVIAEKSQANPRARSQAGDLAYVMYTSGSTGQPKGVAVPHRCITRLVCSTDYAEFGPEQTFLLLAPLSFDASTFELWGALLHGAKCVVFADRVPTLKALGRTIEAHGVTTLWLTAALFNTVIDQRAEILSGIRQLLTGGEALSLTHVRRALDHLPDTQLINAYGPTEGTTFTSCYRIPRTLGDALASVPIGSPIANTKVYVLDAKRQAVPIGVAGELYIGGDGLARGYLNQPELSEARFVADPFDDDPEARLYRTGDRVRYLADGNIEFLGRFDEQLKIRGFRVEPGEIEAALAQHPAVNAVVVAAHGHDDEVRLVAYVVSSPNAVVAQGDLREFLARQLPDYMVPSAFVFLDVLPLTANGKLDREALPAPQDEAGSRRKSGAPPRNAVEVQLMRVWERLLGISPIGVQDNFFHLGGHSLLAVRMMERIKQVFDRDLPLDVLWYGRGTIEHLAGMLTEEEAEPLWTRSIPIKPDGTKAPLFCLPIAGGHLFNYENMAIYIDPERPVYGLPLQGVDGKLPPHTAMEDMAAHCIELMREIQANGPYHLVGYCSGGVLAFEMARQLQANGDAVAFLGLIDSASPGFGSTFKWMLDDLVRGKDLRLVQERFYALALSAVGLPQLRKLKGVGESHRWALWRYKPRPFAGRITVFRPVSYEYSRDPALGWTPLAGGGVDVHLIPGRHRDLVKEPGVQRLVERIEECLAAGVHRRAMDQQNHGPP